jgi:mannose PTS system EIIA component
MIGMVLVTHGALAVEFKSALEHVVGPQELVETVAIGPEDDMEERREDILKCVDAADQGDGVVILTDMFGGTPSLGIKAAVKEAADAGRKYINVASEALGG